MDEDPVTHSSTAKSDLLPPHLNGIPNATHNYEGARMAFPSGGWGFAWVGDADRGGVRRKPMDRVMPMISAVPIRADSMSVAAMDRSRLSGSMSISRSSRALEIAATETQTSRSRFPDSLRPSCRFSVRLCVWCSVFQTASSELLRPREFADNAQHPWARRSVRLR